MGVGARWRAQRGGDVQAVVEIDLEEAFAGASVSVSLDVALPCERCGASGAEPDTSTRSCPTCGGAGVVRSVSQNIFGQFVQQRTCPDCGGGGEVLEQPCGECKGEGRVLTRRQLDVDIPKGIHDGQQIRARGEGHAGFRTDERGNAFVVVRVKPDPRFVRDGDDLHTALRLTMTDAALGTKATVSSLSGDVELEVPPGTQPGEVRVLKGEGMPALRGSGPRLALRPPRRRSADRARRRAASARRAARREARRRGVRVARRRGRGVLQPPEERASLSGIRRVSILVPSADARDRARVAPRALPRRVRGARGEMRRWSSPCTRTPQARRRSAPRFRGARRARRGRLGGPLEGVPPARPGRRPLDRAAVGTSSCRRARGRRRPRARVRNGCASDDARVHRAPRAARARQPARRRLRLGRSRRRRGQARVRACLRRGRRSRGGRGRAETVRCERRRRRGRASPTCCVTSSTGRTSSSRTSSSASSRRCSSACRRAAAVTSGYLASETPRAPGWEAVDRLELEGWAADVLARAALS